MPYQLSTVVRAGLVQKCNRWVAFRRELSPRSFVEVRASNPQRFQKEEWVMEKDNMLLLELTEDELDVVAGGCGCGHGPEPVLAIGIAVAAGLAVVL